MTPKSISLEIGKDEVEANMLIAALAARSAFLGHYEGPSLDQLHHARVERWVALPNTSLANLVEPPNS